MLNEDTSMVIDILSNAQIKAIRLKEQNVNYCIYSESDNSFEIEIKRHYSHFKILVPIEVYLTNLNKIEINIYVYENETGMFYSDESIEKAEEAYIDYAIDAGLITKSEYEDLYSQIYYKTSKSTKLNGTKGSKDTYASGYVNWIDNNGNYHPLRMVKVELYDKNSVGGDYLLETTFTDNYGGFFFTFQNNDSIFDNHGSDIYVKIYAGDNNAYVVDPSNKRSVYVNQD